MAGNRRGRMASFWRARVSRISRLPLLRMRLDAAIDQCFVDLGGGFVEAELDDREVRSGRLPVLAEPRLRQLQLGAIEIVERVAEVDEHQVALVPEQRIEGGWSGGVFLHGGHDRGGFFNDLAAFGVGELAPGAPAEAHHLVEDAVALNRKGNCWDFCGSRRCGMGRSGGRH